MRKVKKIMPPMISAARGSQNSPLMAKQCFRFSPNSDKIIASFASKPIIGIGWI